jgi:Protein of unknown function (DUF2911)
LVTVCSPLQGQSVLDLPRPSQKAEVMQRVGLTDVIINYSRPLVNQRKIFGSVVPYGEVWRAGANENSTIQFTDPVSIEGRALPAGIYGLHMIPGEKEWTVIFSKNATSWGSFTYDQKEDALRVAVQPQASDMHEALTYDFDSVTPDAATVTLRWDRVAVPFKVAVDQKQVVPAKLKAQIRGWQRYTWEGWDEASQTLLALKVDLPDALTYADESIKAEKRFETLMMKADVLEAMDRKGEAAPLRAEAVAAANAIQLNSYGRQLQRAGKQDEAFAVFEMNAKRYPGHFVVHYEQSRMLVAKGDYDSAMKEMQIALASADQTFKPFLAGLVKRLQAKEDINKN